MTNKEVGRTICATLTPEAQIAYEMWPKGTRSEKLSVLLAEHSTIHQRCQALKTRIGHLLGILQTCRDHFGALLAFYPHLDSPRKDRMKSIIAVIQDETDGTIFHDYGHRKFHPTRIRGELIIAGEPHTDRDALTDD